METKLKDECFEVELFDPTGGAVLGSITKLAVTITNDEGESQFASNLISNVQFYKRSLCFLSDFNAVMSRLSEMTSANVDAMDVHHNDWTSQIKDVITPNLLFLMVELFKLIYEIIYAGHECERWRH